MADAVTVYIPTALRPQCGDQEKIAVTGGSVRDVLGSLTKQYPELGQRLFKNEHELNRFVNVFVNDEDIRFEDGLDTQVKAGDELMLVPAIAGGSR